MMVLASLVTVSCTSTSDALAEQYRDGSGANYISGDGAITVLAPESRTDSVQFEGDLDTGEFFSSSDYAGSVIVVNFWYAGCPPCRVEAADLESLHQQFLSDGVAFVGVNIFDQAPTALTFANEFGVSYGSIMDVETGSVRLAFAGQVAPNAVPTTLVLDKQGRVSARISGVITDVDLLANIIEGVLEEELGS
ncbi:MAG: TlpA family protein disulfide reductase [Microbacteriaceae bacterium]|nr:TlpA family protein disulfide reductase [Microbacteriaceae bacterium]MBT5616592.1 TlpA family protein disulfide reductase [Microbacteriaceae bacterium]